MESNSNGGGYYSNISSNSTQLPEKVQQTDEGNGKDGKFSVYCKVCPPSVNTRSKSNKIEPAIITTSENSYICVRDPRQDSQGSENMRKYHVTKAFPSNSRPSELFNDFGRELLDWFWNGLNASLITYGQAHTGKTHLLFNRLLEALFERIEESEIPIRVGISMWDVLKDDAFDLLAERNVEEPETYEVFSLEETLSVLNSARGRSTNWDVSEGEPKPLPNSSHSFIRLQLYRDGTLSVLHIVDLVGSQSFSHSMEMIMNPVDKRQGEERRFVNQQLLAFSRVITELAKLDDKDLKKDPHLIAARSTVLTKFLGPIIASNSRTFLLATLSAVPEDYLDTVSTLRVASRSMNISSTCRKSNIPVASISFLPLKGPLPLRSSLKHQTKFDEQTPEREIMSSSKFVETSFSNGLASPPSYKKVHSVRFSDGDKDVREVWQPLPSGDERELPATRSSSNRKSQPRKDREVSIEAPSPSSFMFVHGTQMPLQQEWEENESDGEKDAERPKLYWPSDSESEGNAANIMPLQSTSNVSAPPGNLQGFVLPEFSESERDDNFTSQLKKEMASVLHALETPQTPINPTPFRPFQSTNRFSKSINPPVEAEGSQQQIPNGQEELIPKHFRETKGPTEIAPTDTDEEDEKELLKKNYETVLALLHDEEQLKEHYGQRIIDKEEEMMELSAFYELKIEKLHATLIDTQSKLRKVQENSPYAEIFESYERELNVLGKEVERLLGENIKLEEKLFDRSFPGQKGKVSEALTRRQRRKRQQAKRGIKKTTSGGQKRNQRFESCKHCTQETRTDGSTPPKSIGKCCEKQYPTCQVLFDICRSNGRALAHTEHELRSELAGNAETWQHIQRLEEENQLLHSQLHQVKEETQVFGKDLKQLSQQLFNLKEKYLSTSRGKITRTLPMKKLEKSGKRTLASSLAQRLKDELGTIDPKYSTLLQKLQKEIEKVEGEKSQLEDREKQLLNLIVEYNKKDDPYCQHILHYQQEIFRKAEQLSKLEKRMQR